MTDDMTAPAEDQAARPDPVDVADDFASDVDAADYANEMADQELTQFHSVAYCGADRKLGKWLVAEARYQRDVALRDALMQGDSRATALRTVESYQRVNADLALKLANTHADFGATPDYEHDERTVITDPHDFLAWLLQLSTADRVKTAERILRQADEAGACFFEDHRGRISALESHIELLSQGKARTPSLGAALAGQHAMHEHGATEGT